MTATPPAPAFTATALPSIIVPSTATRVFRPAPQPLRPNDGAVFHGATNDVVLEWSDVGPLAADEFYVVRIPHVRGEEVGVTKSTRWQVPSYLYWLRPANGQFQWSVAVRIRTTEGIPGTALVWPAVSAESTWRWFELQPAGPSTPAGGVTPEATPQATVEPTAEVTPEVTPEATAQPTSVVTAEVTQVATAEVTPAVPAE
jgi:hypothetical protein